MTLRRRWADLVTGDLKHFSRVPGLRISKALTEARLRT
jgi:hypothetical protein